MYPVHVPESGSDVVPPDCAAIGTEDKRTMQKINRLLSFIEFSFVGMSLGSRRGSNKAAQRRIISQPPPASVFQPAPPGFPRQTLSPAPVRETRDPPQSLPARPAQGIAPGLGQCRTRHR